MAKNVRRLYSSFHPETYDLSLTLDPNKMTFSGHLVIDGVKVGRPAKRLTFHQKNLNIKKVKITYFGPKGNKELVPSRINNQKSFDELRIHFDQQIYSGRYQIEFDYGGEINSQLHGIYASTFKEGGQQKTILCTQFESHYAREALPCIDEPEAKSVFNLSLKAPADLTSVISNTDQLESKKVGKFTQVKFEPTPKMSIYLLAFVVGPLKYLEAMTKNKIRVRAYATSDNVKFTKFALEAAVKTLDFYEEYFAIDYPLSKCDLIALPDFSSGAMENWGCITFREQAMLVDPDNTSLDLKQYVANVVAHELTHQWFGNLVTMRWWNDLWLNESFASWMSYLAVDHLFPDWKVWTDFIVDEQGLGLKQDSLEHTHPIEVKIGNPEEIKTVFDAISYEKGASVITMLHDYLGSETFRDGIRLYLSRHAYANAITTDLWRALEEVSAKPVEQFMSRWTTTSGYPLLKAVFNEENVHLEQHRFYLNPLANKDNSLWPVPLFSDLELGRNDPLTHRAVNLILQTQPASYLINKGRRGFYRVIYDDHTLASLLDDGFMERVSDVDRLGLLSDAFEAAKGSYLPTLSVLNMLGSYFEETSVVVWEVMAGGLGSLRVAMDDEDLRELMKPFIRKLVEPELARLGLKAKKSDSHFDKLLRPTILGLAALADEPTVLAEVKRLFKSKSTNQIDPDLRAVVYTTTARHGNKSDFETLVKMHHGSNSPEERLKLTAAITNFKQPELINKALKLIRSDEVRLQDVAYWVSYVFANHYARDKAWVWLTKNWDWLAENLGQDISFYRMPLYVARCYSSLEFLKTFEDFFNQRLSSAFDRSLNQAIETIQWQADWKRRDLEAVKSFFSKWAKTQSM